MARRRWPRAAVFEVDDMMMMGNPFKLVCALHKQRKERMRRRECEARRRGAARAREQGWADLFDHMSRNSAHAAGLASQPVSLTAPEAAVEASRGDADIQSVEESIEAPGALPLARPPRRGDV